MVMSRDTREELMEAIKENILERDHDKHSGFSSMRITSISVLEQGNITKSYEAWIVVEIPDNKEKLYEMAAGFEST